MLTQSIKKKTEESNLNTDLSEDTGPANQSVHQESEFGDVSYPDVLCLSIIVHPSYVLFMSKCTDDHWLDFLTNILLV